MLNTLDFLVEEGIILIGNGCCRIDERSSISYPPLALPTIDPFIDNKGTVTRGHQTVGSESLPDNVGPCFCCPANSSDVGSIPGTGERLGYRQAAISRLRPLAALYINFLRAYGAGMLGSCFFCFFFASDWLVRSTL